MSKRPPIRPLSDYVIDQIAAGEVIERPASIVKELVENAVDAGARRIGIDVAGGGVQRIVVSDDGHGIAAHELPLTLRRHYTSKLRSADELADLRTLGFRGEALASIAAVAELELVSRDADGEHACRIASVPGRDPLPPEPFPRDVGTTVTVARLFDAIPARRRFLKQVRTELLHIQHVVRRAAFCYPAVAFRLSHDGRQLLQLPPGSLAAPNARRWRSLFGAGFVDAARALDVAVDGMRITGFVARTGFDRQTSELQFMAVNLRVVHDRTVLHAVRMAYGDAIAEGRFAAFALQLAVPPETVDVNVHPGKSEVRFRAPRQVHDLVYAAVHRTLHSIEDTPAPETERATVQGASLAVRDGGAVTAEFRAPLTGGTHSPRLVYVGTGRIALYEHADALYLLDIPAAICLLVQARLARGETASRPLLIPETLRSDKPSAFVQSFAQLGVELDCVGECRWRLRAVPVVAGAVDAQRFGDALLATDEPGSGVAVARAAAGAFTPPRGVAERREWLDTLFRLAGECELDPTRFTRLLDDEQLARLMDANGG